MLCRVASNNHCTDLTDATAAAGVHNNMAAFVSFFHNIEVRFMLAQFWGVGSSCLYDPKAS